MIIENGKVGYKDATGKAIIAPQFALAGRFSEGLAFAFSASAGKFGFINTKAEWKIPATFGAAGEFSEGLARVQHQGKWGYIDASGKWIIPAQYQLCYDFSGGLATAQMAGKWGIINKKGDWIVPATHYDITSPSFGWYSAKANATATFRIFTIGQMQPLGSFSSSRIKAFGHEGLAPARDENDRWGMVDTTGQWVVIPQFSNLEPFAEGLAAAEKAYNKWGYINKLGEWVIAPLYDMAGLFWLGVAMVENGNLLEYINPAGKSLLSFSR